MIRKISDEEMHRDMRRFRVREESNDIFQDVYNEYQKAGSIGSISDVILLPVSLVDADLVSIEGYGIPDINWRDIVKDNLNYRFDRIDNGVVRVYAVDLDKYIKTKKKRKGRGKK